MQIMSNTTTVELKKKVIKAFNGATNVPMVRLQEINGWLTKMND